MENTSLNLATQTAWFCNNSSVTTCKPPRRSMGRTENTTTIYSEFNWYQNQQLRFQSQCRGHQLTFILPSSTPLHGPCLPSYIPVQVPNSANSTQGQGPLTPKFNFTSTPVQGPTVPVEFITPSFVQGRTTTKTMLSPITSVQGQRETTNTTTMIKKNC